MKSGPGRNPAVPAAAGEKGRNGMKTVSYMTCQSRMERQFDRFGRQMPARTESPEAFWAWKKEAGTKLYELLGLERMERCPLESQVTEVCEAEPGIRRERVVIQTEPDVWMPVYVLIPEQAEAKRRAGGRPSCVIAPAGHGSGGKISTAGDQSSAAAALGIRRYRCDYGLQLARKGLVALCPDSRGFGERREPAVQGDRPEQVLASSCRQLAHMAEPLGMTVAGMFVWDLMRLIDYIEERDQWNLEDIGCVGFSGGGMQTLFLTALDGRVARACVSGYLYGYKDALLKLNDNCSCNYVPGLWRYLDMGDIGAMIAPRPLVIQSCVEDPLNGERGMENVREPMKVIRGAYACLGAEDRLCHHICPGGHQWHPEGADLFAAAWGEPPYTGWAPEVVKKA